MLMRQRSVHECGNSNSYRGAKYYSARLVQELGEGLVKTGEFGADMQLRCMGRGF